MTKKQFIRLVEDNMDAAIWSYGSQPPEEMDAGRAISKELKKQLISIVQSIDGKYFKHSTQKLDRLIVEYEEVGAELEARYWRGEDVYE